LCNFSRNGPILARNFGTHLQCFSSNLQYNDVEKSDSVVVYMVFIDSVLTDFGRRMNYDARNNTATHEVQLKLFNANFDLVKKFVCVIGRMIMLAARM
jgi:hypothetical protein